MKSPNLYNRLSNRTIALLLLVVIIGLAYAGIRYLFFLNIGTLRFEILNGSTYSVVLKKANIEIGDIVCSKSCSFVDIPAGEYDYVATSTGKLTIESNANIRRAEVTTVTLQSGVDVQTVGSVIPATESGNYLIRTNPIQLVNKSDKKVLMSSSGAIGYSLDSMGYGYFLMFDANRTITAFELSTGRIKLIEWTPEEAPTRLKKLANGKSFVIYSKNGTYLSDIDTGKLTELRPYDDVEASPSGTMIGLIMAASAEKKDLLNLSDQSGDILIDLSRSGPPTPLQADITDAARLYWDGTFGVEHPNGDRQSLNIR